MSRLLHRSVCLLVTMIWTMPSDGQRATTAGPLSFGVSAGGARGPEIGRGTVQSLDARYQMVSVPWLSARGTLGRAAFRDAALMTDDRNQFPNNSPTFGDVSVNASTVAWLVGPEIAMPRGPIRAYAHVLAGATHVQTRGLRLRTYRAAVNGVPAFEFINPDPLPTNTYVDNVATIAFGAGAHASPVRWLRVDVGVRRTLTQRSTWHETERYEVEGDVLFVGNMYYYQRRLNAWSYQVGLSLVP